MENEKRCSVLSNIRRLRKAMKLSQTELAKIVQVDQTAVSKWELDKSYPDINVAKKLATLFNVSLDELLNNEKPPGKRGVKIPVLGVIAAGVPIEAVEDIIDYEEITEELAARAEYFALRIQGDSMEPRIKEGDVVIVRRQPDVESGDVAVVYVNGYNATVKKITKHEEGISLIPFNTAYSPKFFTYKEMAELPIIIHGKVVELRGKF
jgi:repressor LexA